MTELATEIVRLITEEVGKDVTGPLEPTTELLMSGIVDSLGVIRLVHWLEDRLAIEIDAADVTLENFESVDAVVRYVSTLPSRS